MPFWNAVLQAERYINIYIYIYLYCIASFDWVNKEQFYKWREFTPYQLITVRFFA